MPCIACTVAGGDQADVTVEDEQAFTADDPDVLPEEPAPDIEVGVDGETDHNTNSNAAAAPVAADLPSDDGAASRSSGASGGGGSSSESDDDADGVKRVLRTHASSCSHVMATFQAIDDGIITKQQGVARLKRRGLLLLRNAFWRAPALPATGVHGLMPDEPLHDFDLGDAKDTILYLRCAIHAVVRGPQNYRQRERYRLDAMAAILSALPAMSCGSGDTYRRLERFKAGIYVPGHIRTAAVWRQMLQVALVGLGQGDDVIPPQAEDALKSPYRQEGAGFWLRR
jgi:hypothetical protein